ncbi:MAG: aromatic amino acid transporter [Parachlamydiales bacterium]|nr:aromatic amino acid transporter [Parachlamydiales bacterium]
MGKIVGSVMLIMGTLIGGGVLALPIVGIGSGFIPVLGMLLFIWALMIVSGFLFLEVALALPTGENSFTSMASKTLGPSGKIITFVSYLLLLYALVAAYVAGGGSLLSKLFLLADIHVPPVFSGILFALFLGGFVIQGVKAVDYLNRTLFSFKSLFLVLTLLLLAPYVDFSKSLLKETQFQYIWAGAPIFLCAFGYHVLIPTLTNYLDRQAKKIRLVLVLGTFLTLLIYLFWLFDILGIISIESFREFIRQQGSTGEFISMIMNTVDNKYASFAVNGFANITITTSFLGVSLGLSDFLSDAFQSPQSMPGKIKISALTFLPPILFVIFYPQGFILALGYASICVAFSHVMLPALMVWRLRIQKIDSPYRVKGGFPLLLLVFLCGLILIALQILDWARLLPVLGEL